MPRSAHSASEGRTHTRSWRRRRRDRCRPRLRAGNSPSCCRRRPRRRCRRCGAISRSTSNVVPSSRWPTSPTRWPSVGGSCRTGTPSWPATSRRSWQTCAPTPHPTPCGAPRGCRSCSVTTCPTRRPSPGRWRANRSSRSGTPTAWRPVPRNWVSRAESSRPSTPSVGAGGGGASPRRRCTVTRSVGGWRLPSPVTSSSPTPWRWCPGSPTALSFRRGRSRSRPCRRWPRRRGPWSCGPEPRALRRPWHGSGAVVSRSTGPGTTPVNGGDGCRCPPTRSRAAVVGCPQPRRW